MTGLKALGPDDCEAFRCEDIAAEKMLRESRPLTVNLVDLGVGGEDLVGQLLSRGQHLGVVGRDQVLDQLLQLVPVHLEQRLRDGQPQLHLYHTHTHMRFCPKSEPLIPAVCP